MSLIINGCIVSLTECTLLGEQVSICRIYKAAYVFRISAAAPGSKLRQLNCMVVLSLSCRAVALSPSPSSGKRYSLADRQFLLDNPLDKRC